jgi:hypothetical protein
VAIVPIDTLPGSASTNVSVDPPSGSRSSPRARLSGSIARHSPAPISQGVVYEHRSTAETGDRGGGCSTPLPVSPTPAGRFPMDTVPGDLAVSSRSHLTLPEDPVSPRARLSGSIAPHCPSPLSQGGWSMNTVQSEMQETGAGDVPPSRSGEPHPHGGRFSIDTVPGDLAISSRSHLTLLKDPLSAHVHGYPGLSPHTARPPLAEGVVYEHRSIGDAGDRGGDVPPPSPSAPPHGGDSPSIRCQGIWQSLRSLT